MSEAAADVRLDAQGGRASLAGSVGFATVPSLWKDTDRLLAAAAAGAIEVDLTGVDAADSAGLALLVGWLAEAQRKGVQLRYANVPARIRGLANISEVESLIA